MTSPSPDQIAALGAAFDAFARRYKMMEAGAAEKPLNEVDIQTLTYVKDHPGCGPTDVARFLGLANTTMSSATDRLAKRGLLERHRPEGDRRAVSLKLSTEGEKQVAAQMKLRKDMYGMMLGRLPPGDRDDFIRMVATIVNHED